MTGICGWLSTQPDAEVRDVVASMCRALRVDRAETWTQWSSPGISIGVLEGSLDADLGARCESVVSLGGRYRLWMTGEAYASTGPVELRDVQHSHELTFRKALLGALVERGVDAIAAVDGEYQIALWDSDERALTLMNDRFGGLPLYWARSPRGFGFASGVRGVLMAPGMSAELDCEAIREAVSFGGFRLGDRTNVAAVKMLPGASVVTVRDGSPCFRRYWHWKDIQPVGDRPLEEHVETVHGLWRRAIRRRLTGAKRPGQTLSGGLDSRAVLAEAAPVAPHWRAITYGIAGCDDARYGQQAATAMEVTWIFHPLYSGQDPDWLERRTSYVQQTDGLIQLVDLMHMEALPLQTALLDVHISGYVGDAVSGSTFNSVTSPADVLAHLPYYGTSLGLDWREALARAEQAVLELDGAAARFALFEHKLPQSTNRMSAAWRPWLRVRKPFIDYAFFDFCQGLSTRVRGEQAFYERWLRARYPACFATIPYQKTGMPVLTPSWRVQAARVTRFARRKMQPFLARAGLPVRPRVRYYHDDEVVWRAPEIRARIEGTILRSGSVCCDILGREAVARLVSAWFDRAAAPTQIIGALYVFEVYHRDLRHHLDVARRSA